MHFCLAHLSDLHLGPLPRGAAWRNFRLKRLIGAVSWATKRRGLHQTLVGDAIRNSIRTINPDHIAFTGDAVNLAAWSEFPRAADWIKQLGLPATLSYVPGNHDTYVNAPWPETLQHLQSWMADGSSQPFSAQSFPYVHLRRNIALIGLNSAAPQPLHRAAGCLGANQLRDLGHHLQRLGSQGFCRVVLIHHPPLPGLTKTRRALDDASQLADVLKEQGCELVLHGHNHLFMHNRLETRSGVTHIIGAPSASIEPKGHHETAGWNMFRIRRQTGQWHIDLTRHIWKPETGTVEALPSALLSPA